MKRGDTSDISWSYSFARSARPRPNERDSAPPIVTVAWTTGAVFIFFAVTFEYWHLYRVPEHIPGRVVEGLACSDAFSGEGDSARFRKDLYASFFGTTPEVGTRMVEWASGTYKPRMVARDSSLKPVRHSFDIGTLELPQAYFRGLARLTIFLFLLLLSAQVLAELIFRRRGRGRMVLLSLLLVAVVVHAVQWLILIDSYGRLVLASETLAPIAEIAERELRERVGSDPGGLFTEKEAWHHWPFPIPYSSMSSDAVCDSPITWRGVWPLTRCLHSFVRLEAKGGGWTKKRGSLSCRRSRGETGVGEIFVDLECLDRPPADANSTYRTFLGEAAYLRLSDEIDVRMKK